jgi:hypothetical protein
MPGCTSSDTSILKSTLPRAPKTGGNLAVGNALARHRPDSPQVSSVRIGFVAGPPGHGAHS